LEQEQAHGLHSLDGRHFSAELEECCEHMAEVESECAIEAMGLSQSVMGISDAIVDLGAPI
jgi:hypothetical protein